MARMLAPCRRISITLSRLIVFFGLPMADSSRIGNPAGIATGLPGWPHRKPRRPGAIHSLHPAMVCEMALQ
jgi:hypothetical protein